jgi:hypothetical protein
MGRAVDPFRIGASSKLRHTVHSRLLDPTDTVNFFPNLFDCVSVQCDDAYGAEAGFSGKSPTSETLTVTPQVPEPNSLILLAAGIGFVGLLRRSLTELGR